jgi:hypothetical protein
MAKGGYIAFWTPFSNVEPEEKRKRLQDEFVQEIIYNLIIVRGPQWYDNIVHCFGFYKARKASQRVRDNLNVLADQNWGLDPLIKCENGKYALNDTMKS